MTFPNYQFITWYSQYISQSWHHIQVFNKQFVFWDNFIFIKNYLAIFAANVTYHDDDNHGGGGDHGKNDPWYAVEKYMG